MGGEIFLIMIVVLVLFGADKIPEVARGIAKVMREVKKASDDIKEEITKSTESVRKDLDEIKDEMNPTIKP